MRLSKLFILSMSAAGLLAMNPVLAKHADASVSAAEVGSLAIIATVDKTEIIAGVVAVNKKTTSGVADFAKMMIDQHGSNLTQLLELVNELHIKALAGSEAEALSAQGKKDLMKLGALKGTDFDVAYVSAMVTGHQAVLDLIDNHLMKTAKTESVKTFLTETRAAVAEHLEHAKKLQEEMHNP
jgi:putative membrane protein